jgi:AraC-like DNA-binding protein
MTRHEVKREPLADQNPAGPGPVPRRPPRNPAESDRRIGQIINFMMEHLNESIQVAKLASLANVSPSHFFALFKRRTGCAPIDFFIRLRMWHACQLLDGTSLNVKEVAARLGYDDPFYFSRVFKAVNHVAPSEYRMMSGKLKRALKSAALPPLWSRFQGLPRDSRTNGGGQINGPAETRGQSRSVAA